MSAAQSHLTDAHYGYDVVVAIAQAAINNTLKRKLLLAAATGTLPPPVSAYYGLDNAGNIFEMDEATVLAQTNGTDPFSVQTWTGSGSMTPELANLTNENSQFYYGFRVQIGLPLGNAANLPDILTFHYDKQSVTYNMLCHQFQFAVVNYGHKGLASFYNTAQPDGQPWIFTADVKLSKMNDTSNLPPIVQQQLQQMGGQFSVQKLLLEVDNPLLQNTPTLSGVPVGVISDTLSADFLGKYFDSVKANGLEVLNYSIVEPAAAQGLQISDSTIYSAPFVDGNGQAIISLNTDQVQLSTVNYLCSTAGHTLPVATPFSWNWLDTDRDLECFDGVVAVNRNRMIDYFQQVLTPYIMVNSYASQVRVTADGFDADYDWSLTSGQQPTVWNLGSNTGSSNTAIISSVGQSIEAALGIAGTGNVLSFSYTSTSSDSAGLDGDVGKMTLTPTITASVQFAGNTVTISQHLVIYAYVNHLSSGTGGNVIDKMITDVYEIGIGGNGQLTFVKDATRSQVIDNSQTPSVNGFLNFFNKVNELISDVQEWANSFVPTAFTDIPLSNLQSFVFPGGESFVFEDVSFSSNLDLVAHIRMK
jgi:hypothetical protein